MQTQTLYHDFYFFVLTMSFCLCYADKLCIRWAFCFIWHPSVFLIRFWQIQMSVNLEGRAWTSCNQQMCVQGLRAARDKLLDIHSRTVFSQQKSDDKLRQWLNVCCSGFQVEDHFNSIPQTVTNDTRDVVQRECPRLLYWPAHGSSN